MVANKHRVATFGGKMNGTGKTVILTKNELARAGVDLDDAKSELKALIDGTKSAIANDLPKSMQKTMQSKLNKYVSGIKKSAAAAKPAAKAKKATQKYENPAINMLSKSDQKQYDKLTEEINDPNTWAKVRRRLRAQKAALTRKANNLYEQQEG